MLTQLSSLPSHNPHRCFVAAGYYIWRDNGLASGRCLGFEDNRGQQMSSSAMRLWVPFAYDAALVMMHGLHRYIEGGGDPDQLGAQDLFRAMTNVSFDGT